jgi:putative aldouronate transport system permease protein
MPAELEESAAIEGANDIVILFKIFLPLSTPVLATLTLFYAVGWWNQYMGPLFFISDPQMVTLMLKLRQLLWAGQNAMQQINEEGLINKTRVAEEAFKAASIMVSTLPIICVYPFLQKYFVKGVMIGSLKG